MFQNYLLEKFIPWSLKIDYKNSVKSITKEKEQFMCDMYNHFASYFKELSTYELHMFRVSFSEIKILNSELISILLPNNETYHSIYILHNDENYFYFTLNKNTYNFELKEYDTNSTIEKISKDLENLVPVITNYILMK